jgi:hypothetical protein
MSELLPAAATPPSPPSVASTVSDGLVRVPVNSSGESISIVDTNTSGDDVASFKKKSVDIPTNQTSSDKKVDYRPETDGPFDNNEPDENILDVVPKNLENQCEGKPPVTATDEIGNRVKESGENNFKRSLYFYYSIKNQTPVDLSVKSLDDATEAQFIKDWQKAISIKGDKLDKSLVFLNVPKDRLSDLDRLYAKFENGGQNVSPLLAYDCAILGEQVAGYLDRFLRRVEDTPAERSYYFEHQDWFWSLATDYDDPIHNTIDPISVAFRDKAKHDYMKREFGEQLDIVTNHGIKYDYNNYLVRGSHIHELTLVKDLFPKGKDYVIDIHPRLMYMFYRERDVQKPLVKGGTRSIQEHFLEHAFNGNYVPLYPNHDQDNEKQMNIAFYTICHIIGNTKSSRILSLLGSKGEPSQFYSKQMGDKLPMIVKWLKNATDAEFRKVQEAMMWVAPNAPLIKKADMLAIYQAEVDKRKQPGFLNRFTRKNKPAANKTQTRSNRNAPPVPPRHIGPPNTNNTRPLPPNPEMTPEEVQRLVDSMPVAPTTPIDLNPPEITRLHQTTADAENYLRPYQAPEFSNSNTNSNSNSNSNSNNNGKKRNTKKAPRSWGNYAKSFLPKGKAPAQPPPVELAPIEKPKTRADLIKQHDNFLTKRKLRLDEAAAKKLGSPLEYYQDKYSNILTKLTSTTPTDKMKPLIAKYKAMSHTEKDKYIRTLVEGQIKRNLKELEEL